VEIHVHLNATEPLSTFSGANIRFPGQLEGFAKWPAGAVESHGWLRKILNTGLPDWRKKATWVNAPLGNEIVWIGNMDKGSKIKEAEKRRDRTLNSGYVVKFKVAKNKDLDADIEYGDDGRKNQVSKLLGLPMARISTVSAPGGKTEIALTYENEQVASAQLAEHEFKVRQQWKNASDFSHTPT
jgi:sugar-specific transcriptional regulator TrmB